MKNIFQKENPFWLSDTYIFSKYYFEGNTRFIFIKINYRNKIEEIGIDLAKRTHGLNLNDSKEATKLQKSIFRRIGEEYWWGLYRKYLRGL